MDKESTPPLSMEEKKKKIQALVEDAEQGFQKLIWEGSRLFQTHDIWKYAAPTDCDVLITLPKRASFGKQLSTWLIDTLMKYSKQLELDIKICYHSLAESYALYISAKFTSLLRGAELFEMKKALKRSFGGELKEFTVKEALSFEGIEDKRSFFDSTERAMIVNGILGMIKSDGDEVLKLEKTSKKGEKIPIEIKFKDDQPIISALQSKGLIKKMMPIHQRETLKDLNRSWVWQFFEVQPIEKIKAGYFKKEYFGIEVALYFTWLGHYTKSLLVPTVVGIIFWLFGCSNFKKSQDQENQLISDICFVIFALFNCVWSTVYLELWKRRQSEISYKWGTTDIKAQLLKEPRPQFQGDQVFKNPVTNRMESAYSRWKWYTFHYGVSVPSMWLSFIVMGAICFVLLEFDSYCHDKFYDSYWFHWVSYIPTMIYMIIFVVGEMLFRQIANKLNDAENHRTEEDHENYFIQKMIIFQFIFSFGSSFYIAFYLKDMERLKTTIATLFICRQVFGNFMEIGWPYIVRQFKLRTKSYWLTRKMSDATLETSITHLKERKESGKIYEENDDDDDDDAELRLRKEIFERDRANSKDLNITEAELQSLLPSYEKPTDDYMEMVIQFGYVLLFSPVFPLAPLLAVFNNMFEVRVDAFKLCNNVARPFPRRVASIGEWQSLMEIMAILGVMVNCVLIGQSGLVQRMLPNSDWTQQLVVIVALEHAFFALKYFIRLAIPDAPEWVRIEMAKREVTRINSMRHDPNSVWKSRTGRSHNPEPRGLLDLSEAQLKASMRSVSQQRMKPTHND